MPGKSFTPDQIAEALVLRAAGYSSTAISQRTGISIRSLNRIFQRHAMKKGAVKDELVQQAKKELVDSISSNDLIKAEAARIVADDLAHARLLRERMAIASKHLNATNLEEAALLMRAAAAYSTAIKNTSDMLRHSLRTERALDAVEADELPELVLREITAQEAARMRSEDANYVELPLPSPATADADAEAVEVSGEANERISEGDEADM